MNDLLVGNFPEILVVIRGVRVVLRSRWMHLMYHLVSVFRNVVLVLTVLLFSLDHGKFVCTWHGFLGLGTGSGLLLPQVNVLIIRDLSHIVNWW